MSFEIRAISRLPWIKPGITKLYHGNLVDLENRDTPIKIREADQIQNGHTNEKGEVVGVIWPGKHVDEYPLFLSYVARTGWEHISLKEKRLVRTP